MFFPVSLCCYGICLYDRCTVWLKAKVNANINQSSLTNVSIL